MIEKIRKKLERMRDHFIGYPCNADLSHLEDLSPLFQFPINNIGNCFDGSGYLVNTLEVEREVVEFFFDYFHLENGFGYITNGGTEGNLFGLYLARENATKTPIVFYSDSSHYSINKSIKILNLKEVRIPSDPTGEIDYDILEEQIANFAETHSIIISANIGTTMTGAVDNIQKILSILNQVEEFYIHCDAAFSGIFLPLLGKGKEFDFSNQISSLSVSGHKFLGSPIPCGVALCRKELVEPIGLKVEYIGTTDYSISGSRNGITPLILWQGLPLLKRERIINCLDLARYATTRLNELGFNAWRLRHSPIVIFNRPRDEICEKWQLAKQGPIAHLIVTPSVSREMLDEFLKELD